MEVGISSGPIGEMPVSGKARSGGSTSREASGRAGSAGHGATSKGLARAFSQVAYCTVTPGMYRAPASGARRRLAAFRRGP